MTKLILLILLLPFCAKAQKMPDYGINKVRIIEPENTILVEIKPVTSAPHVKPNLFYYWYSSNSIHSTQGGYSGKLLNGLYTEFYLNKNLKEQGSFKKGLKDGVWKSWNEDGSLVTTAAWKKGIIVPVGKVCFWHKINIFKRKLKQPAADSIPRAINKT